MNNLIKRYYVSCIERCLNRNIKIYNIWRGDKVPLERGRSKTIAWDK